MESLPDRACRVLDRPGQTVATLSTVVRLLRADGCAVTEWVLLRALRLDPRFRVLDPLRGPLRSLRDGSPAVCEPGDLTVIRVEVPHLFSAAASPPGRADGLERRVGQSLARLATRTEPVSPMERVRWFCMLNELSTI